MKTVEKLSFWVEGEFLTQLIRNLWEEGSCIKAFNMAKTLDMPDDAILQLVLGQKKLIGNTRDSEYLDFVDDTYTGIQLNELQARFEKKVIESKVFALQYNKNLRNRIIRGVGVYFNEYLHETNVIKSSLFQEEEKGIDYLSELTFIYSLKQQPMIDFYKTLADKIKEENTNFEKTEAKETEFELKKSIKNQNFTQAQKGICGKLKQIYEDDDEKFDLDEFNEDVLNKLNELKTISDQTNKNLDNTIVKISSQKPDLINQYMERLDKIDNLKCEKGSYTDEKSGLLLPDGSFYPCSDMGHIALIDLMKEQGIIKVDESENKCHDYIVERMGWIKISQLRIFNWKEKFTIAQLDFISKMILFYEMKSILFNNVSMSVEDFFQKYGDI